MGSTGAQAVLRRVLAAAREELDMDAAWVSRFENGKQVLQVVDGAAETFGIEEGASSSLAGSYCTRVVAGDLPNFIPDTAADPRTAALAVTEQLGLGSYAGVPIRLPSGDVFGMLCCVGRGPNTEMSNRTMRFLQLLAEAAATELVQNETEDADAADRRARVEGVLRGNDVRIVVQPIVELSSMRPVGAEALARFPEGGPDRWFADADAVGLSLELELQAVRNALELLPRLDASVYLSLNASPTTAAEPAFADLVLDSDPSRIVVEITEHAAVADYDALHAALAPLRAAGVRLSVDDAGAGFASFRHILALRPDIIKLDIALTSGIDTDPVRQALAMSIVEFAARLGATLVAEGVETQGELDHLLRLGFDCGQGYFLARPGPLPLPSIDARPAPQLDLATGPVDELADVAERTAAAKDFPEFIAPILEAVVRITGMDASFLSALRGDQLVRTHVHNTERFGVKVGTSYPWQGSLCHQCVAAGIVWTADVPQDLVPGPSDGDVQSFLSVPVVSAADEILGTLCAIGVEPRYLSNRSIAQVKLLARLVADRLMRETS